MGVGALRDVMGLQQRRAERQPKWGSGFGGYRGTAMETAQARLEESGGQRETEAGKGPHRPAKLLSAGGRWSDGAMERWSDGAMGQWVDGSMGRWSDGGMECWLTRLYGLFPGQSNPTVSVCAAMRDGGYCTCRTNKGRCAGCSATFRVA
ncbi:hypothetical protein BD289DRAFT_58391 [Coniella lustricola]|uniref:Uncharacterized protein n=1 Tax=Coniella lustricola TaxID=2025994 RepID=A0A2T3AI96_9PEZI|nr:hypothetical protein BD289DRAFT_58391 [Coniella lustricola]